MYNKEDSKSSGVITIHHAITYLEMSSYARYLTQQTTTTEEITFTVETSAILNSVKQWTRCPGATVLLGSELQFCMCTCTILAYSHHRKKYYPEPFLQRQDRCEKPEEVKKHPPKVHY